LILAALAADAAPGKNFRAYKKLESRNGVEQLELHDELGFGFIFKIPAKPQFEASLALERAVVRALAGNKAQLPFEVREEVGTTRDETGIGGAIFTTISGNEPDLAKLAPGGFSKTLADAIAAIHQLDTSVVRSAGLPEYSSADVLHAKVAELDKIAATGKVAPELLSRWEQALEDVSLFRFHPTVVHGAISKDAVLLDGQRVVGMTDFDLKVSDPAEDLAWIVGGGLQSTIEDTLLHYRAARPAADENLIQRAALYSELELGSWLVYCLEQGEESAIKQAESLIEDLKEQLSAGTLRDLRASSFAGIAAGTALISEITTPVQQVVLPQESDPIDSADAPVEEAGLEFLADSEPESVETQALDIASEDSKEPNSDELF
jgi:aminoglycoside phosphotransferase (APT) family kinase protein